MALMRRKWNGWLRALPHPSVCCLVCCPMTHETSSMGRSAARRVWSRLPPGAQSVLEDGLSPTDLQSLLLDLARTRAHRTTPASVRRRWQQDRFVQPSPIDPRRLAEVNLLVKHLRFWGEAVSALINHEVMVDLTVIDDALGERIRDTVQPQLRALHLRDSPGRTQGIGYYRSAAFKIILGSDDGTESELGDGGFTAWTATLTADAKERCLISCVSSERLAQLAKHDHQA